MNKTDGVFTKIFDSVASNPCYATIVAIFIICYFIIKLSYKHALEINKINANQLERLLNGNNN